MKIPFAIQAYQSRTLPLAAQRLVNMFAEKQPEDTKSPAVLYSAHGLKVFGTAGSGAIRGMIVMNSILYIVSGTAFYSMNSSGTATLITGTIAGTGRVSMAENGTQLIIVNGTQEYLYTVAGGLTTISDGDWAGAADTVCFLDNYFLFNDAGTRGRFFWSAAGDGSAYDALDFATAEAAPDDCIAVFADHRQLLLFGEHTVEFWSNTGDPDGPFTRQPEVCEKGCGAKFSIAKCDNSVFWLADDLTVRRMDGYTPLRISTHAIEYAIASYATTNDAYAFNYSSEGHDFYALIFPTAAKAWVYDASTGLWHERETWNTVTGAAGRWRVNAFANAYGKNLVGDFNANGGIYELDLDTYTDNAATMQRIASSPHMHADRQDMFFHSFELDCESGVGLTTGQGSDPQVSLEWSNDGGRTWSNEYWMPLGKIGKYTTRVIWRRLGTGKQRAWRVKVADPVKFNVIEAHVEAEKSA